MVIKKNEQQEIIELMISNYSNSKFSQLKEMLINSIEGKVILEEFNKYEYRLNYYLSMTSIYHTIHNITSIYSSLTIQENNGDIKSPLSNPKGASRMRLEPFVGLLIIQFQKLAETHARFTGIKDETVRITTEESRLNIFTLIKRIKKIREFKELRDGSFAHPFEDEHNLKVYRNQVIVERITDAITKFCEPDIEEIKMKLLFLVNLETSTGVTFLKKEKSFLHKDNINNRDEYDKVIRGLEIGFNEFKLALDSPDWTENFNLLFHGFVSYYFCSCQLNIEHQELKYTTTMKNCIFIKSLYEYTEYVRANHLRNVKINLLNVDDSFNKLYEKVLKIKNYQ